MKHLSTYETGLRDWSTTRFTVMPNASLVFRGKEVGVNKPRTFHCFKVTELGLHREKSVPSTCKHNIDSDILGIKVGNKELLAVSCGPCGSICLLNLETEEVSVVFKHPDCNPTEMCGGEAGEMFTLTADRSAILQLDCSTEQFKLLQIIKADMGQGSRISYIPGHKLIAVSWSSFNSSGTQAISVESTKMAWEMNVNPFGSDYMPSSVVHCAQFDVLFAAQQKAIALLNAKDGSLTEVVHLPEVMGSVTNLCIHDDQLIVVCSSGGSVRVSYFQLCDHSQAISTKF